MDVTEGVTGHQRDDPDTAARPQKPKVILTLSPFTGRSIDERLDALSESIRQWDWRAGDVAPRRPTPQPIQRPPLRAVPPALDEASPRRQAQDPQRDVAPTPPSAVAPAPAPPAPPAPTAKPAAPAPPAKPAPPAIVPIPAALLGPPAPSDRLDFEPPGRS